MLLGLLTLITALSISAVAIYYSVAGLVAIFAAAALPIMIMGGVLEISKLVTAVWLHRYWKQATWWLKTYLSTAVIVLMLITSMGIFGFLSKAHIEQTAQSTDNLARVETIQNEIDRQIGIVGRAENQIRQLETAGTGSDANIQAQIDREQDRIDSAYTRIQPAIDEQNRIIENVTSLFQAELTRIDQELATLQGYIDAGEIKKAQGMVGTATDGAYGPKTAAAFTAWQDAKRAERNEWLQKIQQAAQSPTVKAARDEIARLRKTAEDQIAQSNALINRLRNQISQQDNSADIQKSIDEQNDRIRTASNEIDRLTEEKIQLESEYRKLEAEVGPIKYIAEFIYGESADNNMLEEAVRWVIITIIFVFDPLAVLLLIASQYTFEWRKKSLGDDSGGWLRQWRNYEQARAQRIVDNPGFTVDVPKETSDEVREEAREEEQQNAEELRTGQDEESLPPETGNDSDVAETSQEERSIDEFIEQAADETFKQIDEEEKETRIKELEEQENSEEWHNAKSAWKSDNPNLSLKFFKELFIEGKIEKLPWEDYLERYPEKTYIMKDNGKQVTKTTSALPIEEKPSGYIQNEEQSDKSLWKRVRGKDE